MSKAIIYSTSGKSAVEVEFEGTTWKDLQKAMDRKNVSYNGMKAVVGETKVTLEADNALLPSEEFTLFLMPVKTKSGSERQDLMDEVKAIKEKDKNAKDFFIVDGKNVTQLSTDVIKNLVAKYKAKSGNADTTANTAKESAKAATKAMEKTEPKQEEKCEDIAVPEAVKRAVLKAQEYLKNGETSKAAVAINELVDLCETPADKLAKAEAEKKAKEAERNNRLAEEARKLAAEFKDVKI